MCPPPPLPPPLQALIDIPKLVSTVPSLEPFFNFGPVKAILQGLLPGLVLMIFIAILPLICKLMCIASGFNRKSAVDFGVVDRFYIFMVGRGPRGV